MQNSTGFTLSQLATLTRQIQVLHELNVGVRALKYKARTGTDLVPVRTLPASKKKPKAAGNSRGSAVPVKGGVTAAGFAKSKRVAKRWVGRYFRLRRRQPFPC